MNREYLKALPTARLTRRTFLGSVVAAGVTLTACRRAVAAVEPAMTTRAIPSSGERIGTIGLGTWQAFDVGDDPAALATRAKVLETLVAGGGSVVDSSPMYGRSEAVVGRLAARSGLTDSLFMATKVWTRGRDAGIEQMHRSGKLLGVDAVDLMQIHNLVDWREHSKTLARWKEEGRVRYVGITHYQAAAHADLERVMEKIRPDFIQVNYSVVERAAAERLLPRAADLGVAVLVNRPYAAGAVFRATRGRTLPGWASQWDCDSVGQLALKYILANSAVTCVIPGTSKPHHMEDNLGAGSGPVPDVAGAQQIASFFDSL